MYHISDSDPPPCPDNKKIILFDDDEIEMLTRGERLTVLTIQQQLALMAVDEKIEAEKNADVYPDISTASPNLPFEELLDLDAAMFDDRSLYLRPKVSMLVPNCGQDLHKELVRKLDVCEGVYVNGVYQNIHQFGSRMTYQPHLELSTLERVHEEVELSEELKMYVRNLGKVTYDILVQSEILGNPTDLEVYQSVGVTHGGQSRSVTSCVDLITCHLDNPKEEFDWSEGSGRTESPSMMSDEYSKDSDQDSKGSKESDSKGTNSVINESVHSEVSDNQASGSLCSYSEDTFNSENNDDTNKTDNLEDDSLMVRIPFKSHHQRAAVSFIITLRQSVPVKKIFHQHLASMGHADLTLYLVVCHLGPLVDNQVVLYEYRSRMTTEAIDGADLDKVMATWARLQGRLVFPVTPVNELVKHSIYRYEGLSKPKKEKKRRKVIKLYID